MSHNIRCTCNHCMTVTSSQDRTDSVHTHGTNHANTHHTLSRLLTCTTHNHTLEYIRASMHGRIRIHTLLVKRVASPPIPCSPPHMIGRSLTSQQDRPSHIRVVQTQSQSDQEQKRTSSLLWRVDDKFLQSLRFSGCLPWFGHSHRA